MSIENLRKAIAELVDVVWEDTVQKGGHGSGNFGYSGRPGEIGGSGEAFHGTSTEAAEHIVNEGLKPGYFKEVYATTNFRMAVGYAIAPYAGAHTPDVDSVAIVVVNEKALKLDSRIGYDEKHGTAILKKKGSVPASEIKRVEIYSSSELLKWHVDTYRKDVPPPKPVKIVEGQWKKKSANGDVYCVVLTEKKTIVKGGADSGFHGHSGRPGQVGGSSSNIGKAKFVDGKWMGEDGPLPAHIQSCRIPPGWHDVEYNLNPEGDMLIRARDKKNRYVYVYSEKFNAENAKAKFARTTELEMKYDDIIKQVNSDISSNTNKEEASCLKLIMETSMRPGSAKDTQAKVQAYGATTLEGRHIVKDGEKVRCQFIAKEGIPQDYVVEDKSVVSDLLKRKKAAGDNGKIFDTDSGKLLSYTKSRDGGGFKTKDIRTVVANRTAVMEMVNLGWHPKSKAEYLKATKTVARAVAAKLGNTPTMALKSYINPAIFGPWKMNWSPVATKKWLYDILLYDEMKKRGELIMLDDTVQKGGRGSGDFGHAGIPGHLGGSASGGSSDSRGAGVDQIKGMMLNLWDKAFPGEKVVMDTEVKDDGDLVHVSTEIKSKKHPGDTAFTSTIDKSTGTVIHDLYWMDNKDLKGHGFSTGHMKEVEILAGKLGVKKAELQASNEGRYVWPKLGYKCQDRAQFKQIVEFGKSKGIEVKNEKDFSKLKQYFDKNVPELKDDILMEKSVGVFKMLFWWRD